MTLAPPKPRTRPKERKTKPVQRPVREVKPSVATALAAVEVALREAQAAHPSQRYGYFLRRLPDWVLAGVCYGVPRGDEEAQGLVEEFALRAGWMLHGKKTEVYSPPDDVLRVVLPGVYFDLVREQLRRRGYFARFDPNPDPYDATGCALFELSEAGRALTGEARAWVDEMCAQA